jgi:hypothetical protein
MSLAQAWMVSRTRPAMFRRWLRRRDWLHRGRAARPSFGFLLYPDVRRTVTAACRSYTMCQLRGYVSVVWFGLTGDNNPR